MALAHSPKIVTSELVLCLDAANSKSYPGSGTTWTDLSGNGNNSTLTNGPTFSSSSNGSIVFDGVNDYATISNTNLLTFGSNPFSINFWLRRVSGSAITPIITTYNDYNAGFSTYFFMGIYTGFNSYDNGVTVITSSGSFITALAAIPITNNQWVNICLTRSGFDLILYQNGKLYSSASSSNNWSGSGRSASIGGNVSNTSPLNGNISQVSIYNRALTAAEVGQNFAALRGRYGI